MTERRNPLAAMTASVPQRQEITAANIETAGAGYVDGFCPHCGTQMVSTQCGHVPAYVCLEHRTVLPVKQA